MLGRLKNLIDDMFMMVVSVCRLCLWIGVVRVGVTLLTFVLLCAISKQSMWSFVDAYPVIVVVVLHLRLLGRVMTVKIALGLLLYSLSVTGPNAASFGNFGPCLGDG